MAEYIECIPCAEFGVFGCRETVGTCDLCGQRRDVFMLMDYVDENDFEGTPLETVCLTCLCNGKHMKHAHLAPASGPASSPGPLVGNTRGATP